MASVERFSWANNDQGPAAYEDYVKFSAAIPFVLGDFVPSNYGEIGQKMDFYSLSLRSAE